MLNEEMKARLKQRLDEVHDWPSVYMFKFIFEPNADRLDKVLALFSGEADVQRKYSTGGKYVSISAQEVMIDADEVVARYDKASDIAGVIAL
jgi:putative lipoic acid-binding regulatory protein